MRFSEFIEKIELIHAKLVTILAFWNEMPLKKGEAFIVAFPPRRYEPFVIKRDSLSELEFDADGTSGKISIVLDSKQAGKPVKMNDKIKRNKMFLSINGGG